jgi:hypothetical protein
LSFGDQYEERTYKGIWKVCQKSPVDLQDRILYVQSAEGSTGDGYCYKGDPLNERYKISRDQWSRFRMKAWEVFEEALSDSSDLTIKHLDGDGALFHMLELQRSSFEK